MFQAGMSERLIGPKTDATLTSRWEEGVRIQPGDDLWPHQPNLRVSLMNSRHLRLSLR